jgi:hypothetical protein
MANTLETVCTPSSRCLSAFAPPHLHIKKPMKVVAEQLGCAVCTAFCRSKTQRFSAASCPSSARSNVTRSGLSTALHGRMGFAGVLPFCDLQQVAGLLPFCERQQAVGNARRISIGVGTALVFPGNAAAS